MRNLGARFIATVFAFLALANHANTADLLIGVSVDTVPVQSDFSGTDIVVFGAIDAPVASAITSGRHNVVVVVEGPQKEILVRKKNRVFGIWANSGARPYSNVPSFYSAVTDIPFDEIASDDVLRQAEIGIENIGLNLVSRPGATFSAPDPEYATSLRRIKSRTGLFTETNRLEFLSQSLFRAYVTLPANVPIGEHTVKAYVFKNGRLLDKAESSFKVKKAGFERLIYETAHENSLIYGILAVILAIFTGWSANVIFRKD